MNGCAYFTRRFRIIEIDQLSSRAFQPRTKIIPFEFFFRLTLAVSFHRS